MLQHHISNEGFCQREIDVMIAYWIGMQATTGFALLYALCYTKKITQKLFFVFSDIRMHSGIHQIRLLERVRFLNILICIIKNEKERKQIQWHRIQS